ncbi:MAG: sensor histidine kinase [Actinobacteria bacterium]|nr:sensor histidine kinase [Actinomycetota bacterium]
MTRTAFSRRDRLLRTLVAVAAVGWGLAAVWAVDTSSVPEPRARTLLYLVVGWSSVAAGLAMRPDTDGRRVRWLLVAVGFLWFLGVHQRSCTELQAVLGWVADRFGQSYLAVFAHLVVSYPSGRLRSRRTKALVTGAYLNAVVASMAIAELPHLVPGVGRGDLVRVVWLQYLVGIVTAAGIMALLVGRWRAASPAARRVLAPVLWSGCVAVACFAVLAAEGIADRTPYRHASWWLTAGYALVPLSFIAGLLRSRLARAGVARLVIDLDAGPSPVAVRDALARVLRDPDLQVGYRVPDQEAYLDVLGSPLPVPDDDQHRMVTPVLRQGRPIAVLVHDRSVARDPDLVEAVRSAAGLALQNEQLQAELRARVAELAASRARILEAVDAERHRIERDLHDGAQQRLVSVTMLLVLLEARCPVDGAAGGLLAEARETLAAATAELRQLSQGIHPSVLTERGLGAAVEELAWVAPVPVELDHQLSGRLPPAVEAAAYFVTAEALTNVAKHSHARSARVSVRQEYGRLRVVVADDGVGGADITRSSGLRGIADRVEALRGTLSVGSPLGGGTTVVAELPCES